MDEQKTKLQLISELNELRGILNDLKTTCSCSPCPPVKGLAEDSLNKFFIISRKLTTTTDIKQLYHTILRLSNEALSFDFITLMLLSEDGAHLMVHDTIGFSHSLIGSFGVSRGQGLATYVLKTRQPETVLNFHTEQRFEVPEVVKEHGITSALCVPMIAESDLFGVLVGHTLEQRFFTKTEIAFFQNIANLSAIAIKNAQHLKDLRESKEQYRDLFEHANDLIQSVAPDGRFLYVNNAWHQALGYSEEDVQTMNIFDIIHPDCKSHCMEAFQSVLKGECLGRIEVKFITKNGMPIVAEGNVNCSFAEGKPVATRAIFRDITERKIMEEEMRYQARHDLLTGLPNRFIFMEHLSHAMKRADRNATLAAVMFIDLDKFKNINDLLGHAVGDMALKQVAFRLQSGIRKSDIVTRMGGDEFVVLLADMLTLNDITTAVEKIITIFDDPFIVEDIKILISSSIGVSIYPLDSTDSDSLLKCADKAMYRVKKQSGSSYVMYRDVEKDASCAMMQEEDEHADR